MKKVLIARAGAVRARAKRLRAGLSRPQHHPGGAVSAGRPVRHHGAHDRRPDVEGARPADHRRERHRRRRHHRHQPASPRPRPTATPSWCPARARTRRPNSCNKDLPYRSTDFEQIGLINISPMVLVARAGVPANNLKDFVAYLQSQREESDRSRRRRRLDLQSRLLGVPFGRRRAPDGRLLSRHAAGDHGSGRRHRRLRLQPDRQHRPAHQDRQAQGLRRDRRQALADAAGRADHQGSRPAAVQPHGLVRPVGAEGHAAADRRQAQQGARRRAATIRTWSSALPTSATTWCRRTSAAPPTSTNSTRTKSRCGRRCSAASAWAPK